MSNQNTLRDVALAASALCAAMSVIVPAVAAEKAATKPAGTYVSGDFHNHTTCSDGALSLQRLVDRSVNAYSLDWFVQADHGGSSARNCTLREDPFEPVAPALGLSSNSTGPYGGSVTYPSGGQPASTGKGPNQSWTSTLPDGIAGVKGDGAAAAGKRMWRWQEIKEFQYPVLEAESRKHQKPVWIGLETNNPGHEHTSTTILTGQLPWPKTGNGNANLMAQFEYCFDRSDTDTSRGAENQWDCSVAGSPNNSLIDPVSRKIAKAGNLGGGNSAANPDLGHIKSVEAVKWMNERAPNTSYYVPAHLERAGIYSPTGNRGFNIEHLRNFNNAAPRIAFGFESMPGHQASPDRGSYGTGAAGGGTFGGSGAYAGVMGGVWDALLGEGRNWWFFASSDYHNRGSFGADQRESDSDFFPGEYTKDHVMVRKGKGDLTAEGIIDGLRSGNSYVANGDVIDRLSFVVCTANPALPVKASQALVEKAVANAVANKGEVRIDGCATMGEKLVARPGADLIVAVAVRDPQGKNNSPYSFPNPSLKQIGITQPLDKPELDHVDLIGGLVTGYVSPSDTARYAGPIGSDAASNKSSKILKVFNKTNWTAGTDGVRTMSYRVPAVKASQYMRLRGTNLPAATPFETDKDGNPLSDWEVTAADQSVKGNVPCADAACPPHMRTVGGIKYSSLDVAAWADLWFYSNPVFVEVINGVKVAGVK